MKKNTPSSCRGLIRLLLGSKQLSGTHSPQALGSSTGCGLLNKALNIPLGSLNTHPGSMTQSTIYWVSSVVQWSRLSSRHQPYSPCPLHTCLPSRHICSAYGVRKMKQKEEAMSLDFQVNLSVSTKRKLESLLNTEHKVKGEDHPQSVSCPCSRM